MSWGPGRVRGAPPFLVDAPVWRSDAGRVPPRRLARLVGAGWKGGAVDVQLAALSERVAVLADAWLAGGGDDVRVRLEAAVAARRAYLQPPLLPA